MRTVHELVSLSYDRLLPRADRAPITQTSSRGGVTTTHRIQGRARYTLALAFVIGIVAAGCGSESGSGDDASSTSNSAPPTEAPTSSASTQPTEAPAPATEVEMRGEAATSLACKLLTLEQVIDISGLNVSGMLGLPTQGVAPSAVSESCTWFLDSKEIQASLVVQYTVFPTPPANVLAYYPKVVQQGFAKEVPDLGDYSKISSAVLDTIDRRAEIHVTLRLHYPDATPEDQAKTIAIMRLVTAGIPQ